MNEPDLIAALDSGHLSGATLDVFETEPLPETSPIWKHPKIIATPHIAAITSPLHAVTVPSLDGIAKIERGETPDNIVGHDARVLLSVSFTLAFVGIWWKWRFDQNSVSGPRV